MYLYSDLKWLKNVTREKGTNWAYMEFGNGDVFNLNWPKRFKRNAANPKIGDIIMIFQTIKKGLDLPPDTYFTHLVTPLEIIVGEQNSSHPYYRKVGVIAKAEPAIAMSNLAFTIFKANRGACLSIELIDSRENLENIRLKNKRLPSKKINPISLEQKQLLVWNLFANKQVELFNLVGNILDDDEWGLEGKQRTELRNHKFYERNPIIVKQAKEKALAENRLICEVCDFNFKLVYPEVGIGFIECHHRIPIANGVERKTKIEDLALVCSNCHRMLHRLHNGKFLSIDDLKLIFRKK